MLMNKVLAAGILAALSLSAADAASLTIAIAGIGSASGNLIVGVFDEIAFPIRGKPVAARTVPAVQGETSVTFDDVPPGVYGVKVLHDLNANGKMDFRFGLYPGEPYGFSNDAPVKMGPPAWNDVKFTLKPGANALIIHLR
jgi:uncharacterized protein (DUF2141 family)